MTPMPNSLMVERKMLIVWNQLITDPKDDPLRGIELDIVTEQGRFGSYAGLHEGELVLFV